MKIELIFIRWRNFSL